MATGTGDGTDIGTGAGITGIGAGGGITGTATGIIATGAECAAQRCQTATLFA
jgi:hypothetical protein